MAHMHKHKHKHKHAHPHPQSTADLHAHTHTHTHRNAGRRQSRAVVRASSASNISDAPEDLPSLILKNLLPLCVEGKLDQENFQRIFSQAISKEKEVERERTELERERTRAISDSKEKEGERERVEVERERTRAAELKVHGVFFWFSVIALLCCSGVFLVQSVRAQQRRVPIYGAHARAHSTHARTG